MVRAPICEVCQRGECLCAADEEKLKRGEISELDVKVSRILSNLDDKYRIGGAVEFVRSCDVGPFVLILVRGEIGRLIGKNGRVLRAFRRAIGKQIRIVEVDVGMKKTVQDLFGNVRVVGINKVYRPDGVIYRIVVPRREIRYLSYPLQSIKRALEIALDVPFEITTI